MVTDHRGGARGALQAHPACDTRRRHVLFQRPGIAPARGFREGIEDLQNSIPIPTPLLYETSDTWTISRPVCQSVRYFEGMSALMAPIKPPTPTRIPRIANRAGMD